MTKYRKKPVVIEAFQINVDTENEVRKWSGGNVYTSPILKSTEDNPTGIFWLINTLEGIMSASPGDYIIKGIKGEYYPCKSDIFELTYEIEPEDLTLNFYENNRSECSEEDI